MTKQTKHKYLSVALVIGLLFSLLAQSCKDDFTTDAKYKLSFSLDTLKIDTIFTQMLSPTNVIMVYNKTDEDIKVSSILLESTSNYFQVNVNGKAGNQFSDVKIASGDSLFVFVQIKVNELGSNAPLYIEDKLKFIYNGNSQEVVLSAYGQDVYHIKQTLHIDQNTTWSNDKPYLIYDSIIVDSLVTWTLQPGVQLYLKKKGTILAYGTIRMEGTLDNEVTLRCYRSDKMTSKIHYDDLADQWGGIVFTSSSKDNFIEHALIKGGNFGIVIDSSDITESYRLIIANTQIHNVHTTCLKAHHANILAYNSIFSNGQNGSVILSCGDYRFDHCTIAGYKKGLGYYKSALTLSGIGYINHATTLNLPIKAEFNNCIISGTSEELLCMRSEEETEGSFDYWFNHCLVQSKAEELNDTLRSISVIKDIPLFTAINTQDYQFDFHLKEESPCKEKGDLGMVLKNAYLQTDKEGVIRNTEAAPDLGALQIIVAQTDTTEANISNLQ